MKYNHQIPQEVEKTLNSLDGIQRAKANPYLFTRIKARMEKHQRGWEQLTSFISRPVIAFAVLVLVMLINAWVIFNPGSEAPAENETIAVTDIADEYNLSVTTNYDYENLGNE